MDRALLDRIDVGVYLAGGGISTKYRVLRGKRERSDSIPKRFFKDIRSGLIKPLDPLSLMRLWNIVDNIYVDDETLRWISFLTNLPNFTVRRYKSTTNFMLDPKDGRTVIILDDFIDPTLVSFKPAKEGMESPGVQSQGGLDTFDKWSALDALDRPLGSRSSESLLSLVRAMTFVRYCLGEVPALEYITNDHRISDDDERRMAREDHIIDLCYMLAYVLDHRVNVGVTVDIQQNFLNFGHFVKNYFVPKMVLPNVLFDPNKPNEVPMWILCMDTIERLTVVDSQERKRLFVIRMAKKLGKVGQAGEDEVMKEFRKDNTLLYQFLQLAGVEPKQ
jgi:hypothetical protein